MSDIKKYPCVCGKSYNHLQNLLFHRKKCELHQSQKKPAENITLTVTETSPTASEVDSLKATIAKLQAENNELQLKLQHKDEIIAILKQTQAPSQPINQPAIQQAPKKPTQLTEEEANTYANNYLNKIIPKSKEYLKSQIKENIGLGELIKLSDWKKDISKYFAEFLVKFFANVKDDLPIRCSDTRRKKIYYYETEKWDHINFENYILIIKGFTRTLEIEMIRYIGDLYKNNKIQIHSELFKYKDNIFNEPELMCLLCNEVNYVYIANHLLEHIKL